MNPKYPIYIPSKGRWESRLTVRTLDEMKVPYRVVVEPSEYDLYAAVIPPERLLLLPRNDMKLIGSRCWIMEHSIKEGHERHWQIDDNMFGFFRFNKNIKIPVGSGTIFRCSEDFVDRYDNIALSGFQYYMFVPRKKLWPPYVLNTRVYSCTLVNNAIPYRWRSIYNDDTDISLCALKDGWATVLFNAFLCGKSTTMTVKGGNTEQLYTIDNGRLRMAEALRDLHPDVTTISWKWGRWQHHVDYRKFKDNKIILKPGVVIPKGVNDYGMKLVQSDEFFKAKHLKQQIETI